MFAYCRNNPVNHADPAGLCGLCVAGKNSNQFMTDTGLGGGGGAILIPVMPLADAISGTIADTREKVIAYAETTRKEEYNNQSVYVLLNSEGEVRYVGRTNNPIVRGYQHRNDPAHPWRRNYIMQVVATGLSLEDARLMEQMLISAYSLVYLENARREISKGNISGFYDHVNGLAELIGGVSPEYLMVMLGQ